MSLFGRGGGEKGKKNKKEATDGTRNRNENNVDNDEKLIPKTCRCCPCLPQNLATVSEGKTDKERSSSETPKGRSKKVEGNDKSNNERGRNDTNSEKRSTSANTGKHSAATGGGTKWNKEQEPWHFSREGFVLSQTGPISGVYDCETRKLGEGTYGTVCRGINRSTKAVRAIKTISKAKLKNGKRFKQEIDIMKSLDHPNIVKLFETFEDHKNVYLVLELCRGGELFDRIVQEGYFSEAYAGQLMRSIFLALFYLHKHGIAHRDLKPENFMFLDKGKDAPLKLIDFGLAARFCGGQPMATKAGTPYYVAPQVLQGRYNQKCDMWSAGVMLYILLCGYPPFHGENDAEILSRVKAGKFSFNPNDWKNISNEAKDLVKRLMSFDPNQRLSAEQALGHPWVKLFSTKIPGPADSSINQQILENFKVFRAICKFKKAALTVIALQMSEHQIHSLKDVFMALDENGDGMLSCQEVRTGLKLAGIKNFPADIDKLLAEVDSDGSGCIDYTEFIAASLDRKQYIQEDVCWAAFRLFDIDGNGKISASDLAEILLDSNVNRIFSCNQNSRPSSVAPEPNSALFTNGNQNADGISSVEEAQQKARERKLRLERMRSLIKDVDKDGDGEVDFEEFMMMMRSGIGR